MIKALLLAASLSYSAGSALAFDPPAITGQCLSCHGADGKSELPHVPIIHGQQVEYLRNALKEYRDGHRTHGRAEVMASFMDGLQDSEIAALAAWFGSQSAPGTGSVLREADAAPQASIALSEPLVTAAPVDTDRVVYIDEQEGWQRVVGADHNRDYFLINSYVESERFLTFCSIASMAAVLNSLNVSRPLDPARYPYLYFTQDNIFTLANQEIQTFEDVVTRGLVLENVGKFLEHLQVEPTVLFAEDHSIDDMRAAIIEGLDQADQRVIVNYNRATVGQKGSGHVSPIGAYDSATDSVLVLDVARYKYPPAWVPMAMLHQAMLSVDSDSKRSRGLVVVRNPR